MYIYIYNIPKPLHPQPRRSNAPAFGRLRGGLLRRRSKARRRENMVGVNMVLAEFIMCLRVLC